MTDRLDALLAGEVNKQGKPVFEVHNWEKLSPFYNIARMIDLMTFFIKLMLIAIVLISIMNVMIMAVYERIREIGTIAAIGTPPRKILSMFLIEGLCLGVLGAISGGVLGVLILWGINMAKIAFDFGQQKGIILSASLQPARPVDRLGDRDPGLRRRQPPAGPQGVAHGADRRLEARVVGIGHEKPACLNKNRRQAGLKNMMKMRIGS